MIQGVQRADRLLVGHPCSGHDGSGNYVQVPLLCSQHHTSHPSRGTQEEPISYCYPTSRYPTPRYPTPHHTTPHHPTPHHTTLEQKDTPGHTALLNCRSHSTRCKMSNCRSVTTLGCFLLLSGLSRQWHLGWLWH